MHTLITLQNYLSAETTSTLSLRAVPHRMYARTHTLPCQSIISEWQLFLQSCLLFCLLLSCLCSHASLTDTISPFHRQGALLPLKAALLFIPLHHLYHHGQCPESHFKGQTSSLHCCQTISFNR